jgi:hypothetical protein
MMEYWNIGRMGLGLRLVELTLSPSCKLYEQEAGLNPYVARRGLGEDTAILGKW